SPGLERPFAAGMRLLGLAAPAPESSLRDRLRSTTALVSPSYFQSAIRSLEQIRPQPTSLRAEPGALVIRADGTYTLSPHPSAFRPDAGAQEARLFGKAANAGLLDGSVLVERNLEIFDRLLAALTREGVRVRLFLPPIHPEAYDALTT